jgi:hypothetical protein
MMKTKLHNIVGRIRETLGDPAFPRDPETIIAIELTRAEWKQVRDALLESKEMA